MDTFAPHILTTTGSLFLLLCSAFFSGSETALFSLNRDQVHQLSDSKHHAARLAVRLLWKPDELLVAILLGNMIVNVLFFCNGAVVARQLGIQFGAWAEVAAGAGMLALIILIGEVFPKAIGVSHPERVALLTSEPMALWCRISRPINRLTLRINQLFTPADEEKQLSHDELKMLFSMSSGTKAIPGEEKELLEEIVHLAETRVSEIMTPRVDGLMAELNTPTPELLKQAAASEISSIPVYRKDEDQIIGTVQTRNLFLSDKESPLLRDHLEPVVFVPETKKADTLLNEFIEKDLRIAIAVDEYGGLAGVITLEDLLEEASEDFDEERESEVDEIDEQTFRLNGRMPIREWRALFLGFIDEDEFEGLAFDTVGGLVVSLLGRMPAAGDVAELKNLRFTVERVSARHIQTVLLQRTTKGADSC
ncbi:hemolysin family protein [Verrucomicrobiota bacterium]